MSVTLTATTIINGAVVETDVVTSHGNATRDDMLQRLDERHELASDGYDNVGGVRVVTEITGCDEYPDLIGTRREWRN
ncbi:hypothetical protein ACT17_14760 [Mycolicibacterium conceptionense]|uniref:Uncharacterized protein n=1 Tax=Mycolicibacterium conceptionense TaxID=451644 RepID=A0A0J8UAZ0_9MYCO|nr:hypothetical protein [Mycolicibacterium conceptionense]KMV17555.1 hypothetical protein ACT17_14760 [Mycolicibacterium conceptionense]